MMRNEIKRRLLDEHDAAQYIGVSVYSLRFQRCHGHLPGRAKLPPFVKVGRSVRYAIEDLDSWVDALKEDRQCQASDGGLCDSQESPYSLVRRIEEHHADISEGKKEAP